MSLNVTRSSSLDTMKAFIIASLCIGIVWSGSPVAQYTLNGLTDTGTSALAITIKSLHKNLNDSLDRFAPINETCKSLLNGAIATCIPCAENKCEERIKSVCSPDTFTRILMRGIEIGNIVHNLFASKIPNLVVNDIGGTVTDIGRGTGRLFSKVIPNAVVNFGKDKGKIVISGASDVLGRLEDIGKKIGNIGKIGINVGKDILGKIRKYLDYIPGLNSFLRKRELRSEPSCSELESNVAKACQVYTDGSYCQSCSFNPDTDCEGYAAARAKLVEANNALSWMEHVKDWQYIVREVTIDYTKMKSDKFEDVKAKVRLFGKELFLTISEPITPYEVNKAGPMIAMESFAKFLSSL